MDKNFGGVIWTNHAISRMRERGIKQSDAWSAWRNPDQSRRGKHGGNWVYYKTFGEKTVDVVAKKNERGEWLILSVWSKAAYKVKDESKDESFLMRLVRRIVWGKA